MTGASRNLVGTWARDPLRVGKHTFRPSQSTSSQPHTGVQGKATARGPGQASLGEDLDILNPGEGMRCQASPGLPGRCPRSSFSDFLPTKPLPCVGTPTWGGCSVARFVSYRFGFHRQVLMES